MQAWRNINKSLGAFTLFLALIAFPLCAQDLPPRLPQDPMGAPPGIGSVYFPVLPQDALPDAEPSLVPLVTSRPLAEAPDSITSAIIYIHDLTRNAQEGVAALTTLAGSDDLRSLIIAPQFLLATDIQRFRKFLPDGGSDIPVWPVGSWWQGGESQVKPPAKGVSSFTVIDVLLMYLADRKQFPSLRHITLAGHGMGADFVMRYAAMGKAAGALAADQIALRYVAANPASYLYMTRERPVGEKGTLQIPDATACPAYQDYPYGLGNLNRYGRTVGLNQIRMQYPMQPMLYLLGGDGAATDIFLDNNCPAQLQGSDRLTRGQHYQKYLMRSFGDVTRQTQKFVFLPKAGYDPVALFGSYCGMAYLFANGDCAGVE